MNDEDLRLAPRTRAADLLTWAAAAGHDRAPVAEAPLRTVLALLELGGTGTRHNGPRCDPLPRPRGAPGSAQLCSGLLSSPVCAEEWIYYCNYFIKSL